MVVITGATGLLGSVLVDHFVSRKIPVTALCRNEPRHEPRDVKWVTGDVTDITGLSKIVEGADGVVHAAAMISFASRQENQMMHVNVEGTANVVNACLKTGVKRLVHISSVAALGRAKNQKLVDESALWMNGDNPSRYGLTKYMAELEVSRGESEGLSVAIVNPSVILAPGHLNRSTGRIFQYLKEERPFYTDGNINYVDARDVAEMALRLFENRSLNGRYIANAGNLSWKEFFERASKTLGTKPPTIKVSSGLTALAAAAEWVRSSVMGTEPKVTLESARLARNNTIFSNKKAKEQLAISFRDLDSTLDWCCQPIRGQSVKV